MERTHVVFGTGAIALALADELELTQPLVVDGSKATERLALPPAPMDDVLVRTVAWFRRRSAVR